MYLLRHYCTSSQCGCRGPRFLQPRTRRRCHSQDYCYRCLGVVAECTVVDAAAVVVAAAVASDASAAFAVVDAVVVVAVVAFVAVEELVLVEIVADAGGD